MKNFSFWFVVLAAAILLAADAWFDEKKLDAAYSDGYVAAELEWYQKGYDDGRESGLDAARIALEDPDGLVAEFILSGEYK